MIYHDKAALIKKMIRGTDVVLDVGFQGQGVQKNDPMWPHALLKQHAKEVYGLDLALDEVYTHDPHYLEASAEDFDFKIKFDVIFAGDLIEHLSNPGLFLDSCRRNLAPGGRVVITTPSAFNLFNLAEKLTKREPTVNKDHTCYFNEKTLSRLLEKNAFTVVSIDSLYSLGIIFNESWKKKGLNMLYALLARFTDKFIETLVVVAEPTTRA